MHYTAMVWVNVKHVVTHSGGHLPFQTEVTSLLSFIEANRVTVAVNNTLTRFTVPQGEVRWREESARYPAGYSTLEYNFDFFNYAGLHRPVSLHTTPQGLYITDLSVTTQVAEDLSSARLSFTTSLSLAADPGVQCTVQLWDGAAMVGEASQCQGAITVAQPSLWWPHLMAETAGHLLELRVSVFHVAHPGDRYTLPVGLREVTWGANSFRINHKPFYFRGFGRHEDSNIRGKGLDLPLVARDHNLIKWIGANSYRTSHYPYAEQIMDFADRN